MSEPSQQQFHRLGLMPALHGLEEGAARKARASNDNGNFYQSAKQLEVQLPSLTMGAGGRSRIPISPFTGATQGELVQPASRDGVWKPGTFGFDTIVDDESALWKLGTLPLMGLMETARVQGLSKPASHSEISSAAGNAAFIGVGNIGGSVLKYVSNFIIQRGFGPGPYGVYTISFSLVTLVAALFNLGLDDAMVRYVAIYRSKRLPGLLLGLTIVCTSLAGGVGILGAFLVFYFAPVLASLRHSANSNVILVLQVMAPMVPLICMQTVWLGGLRGFKAFRWRVLAQRLLLPFVSIVLLILFYFIYHSITGVAVATLIGTILSTVLSLWYLLRMVSRVGSRKPERQQYQLREWIGFALPNFLTSIIDIVLESTDTLLLAFFAISDIAIGQYNGALKISAFIAMPLASLNIMFAPTIAELYSSGEHQKLITMFKVVTQWSITFSLPIFGVVTIFTVPILSLSGPGFTSAWPLVIAFSVGSMINAATGSVGYMLLMTGHQRLTFLNSLVAVVVNIILGVVLTPRYGAMGTAISTGLALGVVNLMRLLQVRILLKMQPYRREMLKPLAAGVIGALVVEGVLYLLPFQSPLQQLALIPVFLVCYCAFIIFFKFSPEDEIVIKALRKKLLRGGHNNKY